MKTLSSMFKWLPASFFSYGELLGKMLLRPYAVIAVILAVTVSFAWFIPKLSFDTTIFDLVIEDLPETRNYEVFKQIFGSNEIIRVVVKCDDVFDPPTFQRIGKLSETAAAISGVQRVVSLPGIKRSLDFSNEWSLEEFRAIIDGVALFKRNLISKDRKTTALTLMLKTDASFDSVINDIETKILKADKKLSLYQIGMPLVSSALAEFTKYDFIRLPFITFLLMAITLLLIYRNVFYLFLPILCVVFSLIWTFGFMAIKAIPLSILTMIIPVFLIAVGTAYCLHIVSEYLAVLPGSQSPKEATLVTYSRITFPTTLTVITTMIGLGSLFLNRISAIKEFSVISCFGIFSIIVIVLTLLPALMALIPIPAKSKDVKASAPGFIDRFIQLIIELNLNHQRIVFPILGVVVVFCIMGVFQVQVETNPVDYFKADTAISRNFHDIYKDLSGSFPINVVMTSGEDDYFETPGHVASVEKLQKFLETLPGVDKTISFADYMKLVNYTTNQFDKSYYTLPTESFEVRMLLNSYKTLLGEEMLTQFMNPTFSQANILLLTHMSSSSDFLKTRDKILAYTQQEFPTSIDFEVTGFGIIISASNHHLTLGQVKSLSLTVFMIFVIMFGLFLSGKVGLIAVVVNLFPIIINFGIMGWLGIELSMATSLIASIAIGLAVDDTVHYLVRYNHEFRKDLDDKRALKDTLTHIARPVIFTTLTIIIGFSILGFSSFKPTAVFGVMMVITMISALIGDLIILPSLILHIDLVTVWDLVRIKLGKDPTTGIPLFSGLSRIQLHYIMLSAMLKKVPPHEALFYKAEPSDSMYAVISGKLDVYDHAVDADGKPGSINEMRRLLTVLRTGDIVGEMGFLRSVPRSATVIATESSELLEINWKAIQRLHWLSPHAASKFNTNLLTILCDRVDRSTCELYSESTVDDLTCLMNRKGFLDLLQVETARAARYDLGYALCLFTMEFNNKGDAFTIDEQNNVIQEISSHFFARTRKADTLARISYHTFALLIPKNSREYADQVVGRYQRIIDDKEKAHSGVTIRTKVVLSGQLDPSDSIGEELLRGVEGSSPKINE